MKLASGRHGADVNRRSAGQNGFHPSVVDVVQGDVLQRLMVALAAVVVNEIGQRGPQLVWAGVDYQGDHVLDRRGV